MLHCQSIGPSQLRPLEPQRYERDERDGQVKRWRLKEVEDKVWLHNGDQEYYQGMKERRRRD